MAVTSTNVVHEVVNKYNYENWSGVVKTYLTAHDLWDVTKPTGEAPTQKPQIKDHNTIKDETSESEISVEKPKSEGSNSEEDKMNARALHAIQISCGPDALSAIQGISSPKDAWRTLGERFKPDFFIKFPDSNEGESFDGHDGTDKGKEFKKALKKHEWEKVKRMYADNPGLLKGRFWSRKYSALHYVAQYSGRPDIVKDMVKKMSKDDLEIKDSCGGGTALMMAIIAGSVEMVECMLEKNSGLIIVEDNRKFLPIEVALSCDNRKNSELIINVIRLLYDKTKGYLLSGNDTVSRKHCTTVILKCIKKRILGKISTETLDIAFDLLREDKSLAIAKDNNGESPLYVLARTPSLFVDESELGFFERWIYKRISTKPAAPAAKSGGEQDPERGSYTTNKKTSGLDSFSWLVTKLEKLLGIKQIRDKKLVHERSSELLVELCKAVNNDKDLKDGLVLEALFAAVDRGNIKFVTRMLSKVPALWMSTDEHSRDIYMRAIEKRQAKVFTRMLQHLTGKDLVTATSSMQDKFGNNLLHVAATLGPSTQLDRIPGAALQMQREIQWFKGVQKIVQPAALEEENRLDSLTPGEAFTKNHKYLMKKGEKWMKETATYSSVVSALIVTMTFAAALAVPDPEKNPLNNKLRRVLIISNGISLFSSTSSMIVFLGILSTWYEEDDFLIRLPLKLMVGSSTLFISIITMLIAFCAALLLRLPESWIPIPIILLAALTVSLFATMQFRLFITVFKNTFCNRPSSNLKSTEKTTNAKKDNWKIDVCVCVLCARITN